MNVSIIDMDNFDTTRKLCIVCDQTMHRDSTRNHIKSKEHNIKLLLEQFSDSFDRTSSEQFIETHRKFCTMDEVKKTIFVRKTLA